MAIETVCSGCGRRLRVEDRYAGATARCPYCRITYTVPSPGAGEGAGEAAADGAADGGADVVEQWWMRSEHGQEYGPVSRAELERWLNEGRIAPQAQLRSEGQPAWISAAALFPELAVHNFEGQNPFAAPEAANPYAAPQQNPVAFVGRPHRGVVILSLGLVGLVCCGLLAPVAWALGHADLKEIDAGRMDPSGRSTTQVGMILGIVGTILMVLTFGLQAVFVVVGLMA